MTTTADVYCKNLEANRKALLKGRNRMEGEGNMPITYELEEAIVTDMKIIRGKELGKKSRGKSYGK